MEQTSQYPSQGSTPPFALVFLFLPESTMSRLAALSTVLLLTLSAAACAPLGEKTAGEQGKMSFSYGGRGCVFGCGLDRSALQGSMVTITAEGGAPEVRKSARLAGAAVGTISSSKESCRCDSETNGISQSGRSIEPTGSCVSGETKLCSVSIDLETKEAGDGQLEIIDPSGTVVDRVTVRVRPAARIDITVKEGANEVGGVYEVKQGYKVKLESRVYDAAGSEAIFTRHGVSFDYADKTVVKPDSAVLIGSTEVEDMIADRPGETTVKVHAPGAENVVRFRVVP